MKNHTNSDS